MELEIVQKKDGIKEEKYFVSLDFKLIKLVLILPIAAPIVEKAFSSMNNVKNQLTSWMGWFFGHIYWEGNFQHYR